MFYQEKYYLYKNKYNKIQKQIAGSDKSENMNTNVLNTNVLIIGEGSQYIHFFQKIEKIFFYVLDNKEKLEYEEKNIIHLKYDWDKEKTWEIIYKENPKFDYIFFDYGSLRWFLADYDDPKINIIFKNMFPFYIDKITHDNTIVFLPDDRFFTEVYMMLSTYKFYLQFNFIKQSFYKYSAICRKELRLNKGYHFPATIISTSEKNFTGEIVNIFKYIKSKPEILEYLLTYKEKGKELEYQYNEKLFNTLEDIIHIEYYYANNFLIVDDQIKIKPYHDKDYLKLISNDKIIIHDKILYYATDTFYFFKYFMDNPTIHEIKDVITEGFGKKV